MELHRFSVFLSAEQGMRERKKELKKDLLSYSEKEDPRIPMMNFTTVVLT